MAIDIGIDIDIDIFLYRRLRLLYSLQSNYRVETCFPFGHVELISLFSITPSSPKPLHRAGIRRWVRWACRCRSRPCFYLKFWYFAHHWSFISTFLFFSFLFLLPFRAAPAAYGSSQARNQIRAVAASLHHSHSNMESEPCLWPTP